MLEQKRQWEERRYGAALPCRRACVGENRDAEDTAVANQRIEGSRSAPREPGIPRRWRSGEGRGLGKGRRKV